MFQANFPAVEFHHKLPNPLNIINRCLISIQILNIWLFIVFLATPGLFIYVALRNSLPFSSYRTTGVSVRVQKIAGEDETIAQPLYTEECPYGRVYVHDLPPAFNEDLLVYNCSDLDPWNWVCGIAVDGGYGRRATELSRILPEDLADLWHRTNQFSLELIFHRRILHYACRTADHRSAAAFYIPFYAGLAVGKHLRSVDPSVRDSDCRSMIRWIMSQKHWNDYLYGVDHFTAIGRITWDFRRMTEPEQKWGSAFLNMPEMKKIRRLIIEKAWDDDYDVGAPYPTGFHPTTGKDLHRWMAFARDYNRSTLSTFIAGVHGASSQGFRTVLHDYCRNESSGSCRLVDCNPVQCSTDTSLVIQPLLESEFCLEPLGDGFTGRTVFECMIAGSIPVFFWKGSSFDQYSGFWPADPESFSVFIEPDVIRNGSSSIKQELVKYRKEITQKREKVIEAIPRIIYGNPKMGLLDFRDAFDFAVDRVLESIKKEKQSLNLLML
ncbi:xyloglucan galactosyltransferase XLT2-like [Andrographis paniculata]|uniref:xyloglucan galactosyltransferase XLT2-like n=1 Tax=Andrographis paniculata TaxID=175694 RepID=UPI0021E8A1A7|nr:xyloglucan galactosyltransferase XLT2-like [Andrographis paniculata]